MTEQQYVIDLGPEGRGIVDADEVPWLHDKLREPGSTKIRVRATDDDTEGHGATGTLVRVFVEDDDDTEGHAIAIHFPTREEADAFRRRLLVTGVLVGSVALGAVGGVGLANLSQDGQAGSAGGTVVQAQAGPMDAHEAPAYDARAQADQAWSDRLNAQAAAAQTGPMDAHEAPAYDARAQADQAWSDRLNAQAAAAQTGPMDAHEAPAFQEGGASAADETEVEGLGGPQPR